MTFPLYDNLYNETISKTRDMTCTQKQKFVDDIVKIDRNGMELMYALIKKYQITHTNQVEELPYESVHNNADEIVTFDLDKLPVQLKHMLKLFLQKHKKSMEEEYKKIELGKKNKLSKINIEL